MWWQRLFTTVLLTSFVLQTTTQAARADEIAEGERDFVRQLKARQFYDLAEQFCERQFRNCRTADDRAVWQMMLADCREQHAWILKEPGRTQILTHAVQSMTEFVRNDPPKAELDLLLRVSQIEILSAIARIDAAVSEFGPATGPVPLATQAITEGLQQSTAMLEQIDHIRRDIESSVARTARDRTRYVMAELLLLQARHKPSDAALRNQAAESAEQLTRASSDDEMRFRARALLAESLLDNKDYKGFELSVTALTSAAETSAQKMSVAELRIRGLLRREQPSEALQVTIDLEKQDLRSDRLSTLRLASLLSMFELLSRLDSADLRQKTADEFRLLHRRLLPATRGAWRDACDRIALRFSHVEKFGADAATAIESVSDQINAGDLRTARDTLLKMRSTFERTSPEIAATISMQAGDLAVRMSDWQSAETDLTSAIELFHATKNREQEAASDLLRIYALGRHWDAAVTRDEKVNSTLESAYRAALDQHLTKYAELSTTSTAHQWRALLNREADPVAAAVELLSLIDGKHQNEPLLLVQSGEVLMEAILRQLQYEEPSSINAVAGAGLTGTKEAPGLRADALEPRPLENTIIEEWKHLVQEFLAAPEDSVISGATEPPARWIRPVLEIQVQIFSLQRRWTAADDWKKLAADTALHINQLAAFDTSNAVNALPETTRNQQQSHITEALANGHAILVLASYRQLLGFDATQESRDLLLKQSREKRRQIALFLIHQASETKDPIPGDPQLGFLVLDLLSDSKQKSQPIDQQLERLPLLLKASGIADNYQQFDGVLQELTAKPLNDTQLQAITAILQQRGAMKVNVPKSSPSEKSFWASVLKRSKSGEDQWLEASLQLASIAVQERNFKDAAKMLNVIDALHPEWGTPERKTRAAALKAEVESTR